MKTPQYNLPPVSRPPRERKTSGARLARWATFAALALGQLSSAAMADTTTSLTQHGITWNFSAPVEYGQFVNGDYWVLGPVTVASVSPAPGVAPANEVNDLGPNRWGDTGLQEDTSRRNGSMVVMTPGTAQGYDSRGRGYNPSVSINYPYTLEANRSLISSISNVVIPSQQMHHELMWSSEKTSLRVMNTAAVLTCLSEAPPADAFRPTYIGGNKQLYRLSDIRWDRLLNLSMDPAVIPSWEQFERYFERPWIDHLNGSWLEEFLVPSQNQSGYGRDVTRMVSIASLMLHLDATPERKQKLLVGLVQLGIDLRGIAALGGFWNEGGGHTSGRKWPILFAGLMLDDPSFANMPATALFHEDTQTYYGQGWAGQTALWQMVTHHGPRQPYMHIDPSEWGTFDGGWAQTSESYRKCCTIRAWTGQALATLLMGAKGVWDHNAYFDNVEDWMRPTDIYAPGRAGRVRPAEETSSYDPFVDAMWAAHRAAVPSQADGTTIRMWNTFTDVWVANAEPAAKPFVSPYGGTYNDTPTVTLTTLTPDATIRYTLDGSTPSSTNGTVYSGPFTIPATATLKAIAYKSGLADSGVTSVEFVIDTTTTAAPAIAPAQGVYTAPQSIAINSTTAGATLYYTLDGSAPTAATGTLYTAPFTISSTSTVKAIAVKAGLNDSAVVSQSYAILPANTQTVSAGQGFISTAIPVQTGQFTATFTATPSASPSNALVGLAFGSPAAYGQVSAIVSFDEAGRLAAYNGTGYQSLATVPYVGLQSYQFRVVADVAARVYSVFVTPPGASTEVLLAGNYAFRASAGAVTSLDAWTMTVDANAPGTTLSVSNFTVGPTPPAAPSILQQPADASFAVGATATLKVVATAQPSPTYQWRKAGVDIPGATSATLSIGDAQLSDSGSYDVIVTNSLGTVTSSVATLTIAHPPSIAISAPTNGATVLGVAVPVSATVTDGLGVAGVQFKVDGVNLGAEDVAPPYTVDWDTTTLMNGSHTLTAVARNIAGLTATATAVTVNVDNPLIVGIKISGDGTYTQNFNTLAHSPNGTSYPWSNNESLHGWYIETAVGGPLSAYFVGDGSAASARVNSFGTTGNSDRAVGAFPSSATGNVTYSVLFHNDSASPVTLGTLSYTGEQYRFVANAANSNTMWYQVSTSPITSGTPGNSAGWTALPALTFTSPVHPGFNPDALPNATTLNGNDPKYRTALSADVSSIVLAPGQYVMFRWLDIVNSGTNHPLAMDDFSLSYTSGASAGLTITSHPSNQSVQAGGTATFNVAVAGSPTPAYQWRKDGVEIAGATSAALTLDNVQTSDAGNYDVVVSDGAVSLTSNAATLTVTAAAVAPSITQQPVSVSVTVGETATFSVTATGSPSPNFQWRKGGANISGATSATLSIANAQLTDAGNYDVVVTNSAGNATSNVATLTVIDSPPPSGPAVSITASGSYTQNFNSLANAPKGLSTPWENSVTLPGWYVETAATGVISAYYVANGDSATSRVDSFGPIGNADRALGSFPSATTGHVAIGVLFRNDSGSDVTLGTVGYTGEQYRFVANAANSNTMWYKVSSSPITSPSPADSSGWTAIPALTFTSPVHSGFNPDGLANSAVLDGNDSKYRTVLSADLGGVTLAPGEYVMFRYLDIVNGGTNHPLAIDDFVLSYEVEETEPVATLAITQQPGDLEVTAGEEVVLTVATEAMPAPAYQWRKDGEAIAGATSASYAITSASVADAGTYDVVVSNAAGVVTSAEATLVVNPAPALVVISDLHAVYDGSAHSANVATTPAGLPVTVTYNGAEQPPVGAGSYSVIATVDDDDFVGSASATLVIAKQPATIALGNRVQSYDGTPRSIAATTEPAGLAVEVTYKGAATAPTLPGTYEVVATIDDANYAGSVSDTLVVTITALVRHGPALNGSIDGSIQILLPENTTLNGQVYLSGDLLVAGTPAIRRNGNSAYAAVLDDVGAATPSNHTITLNGEALVRDIIRRVDAIPLPEVPALVSPTGTRNVTLNQPGQSAGDFGTLRNLTLNGNAGTIAVPPGAYGTLVANGNGGFVLGVAGASEPSVYHLQGLTLNGNSSVQLVGPVVLRLANGTAVNGAIGSPEHPEWLELQIRNGGLTLNGNVALHGTVVAPAGSVMLNGQSTIVGRIVADRLVLNGNALVTETAP